MFCVEEDTQSTKTSVGGPVCLLLQAATGVNQKRKVDLKDFYHFW